MKVHFLGAAQTVTGSCYLIEACGIRFTVDCGMHQGNSEIEARNFDTDIYQSGNIDFILLTHAHIDHSGLLPRIVHEGFKGSIYCTPPTAALAGLMLEDSAHIQEMEAEWRQKKQKRHTGQNGKSKEIVPLYTVEDARKVPDQFRLVEYNKAFEPHPGIAVTYKDAGHILGSAFLELTVTEDGKTTRVVFSGDLGRPGTLLMHDPVVASQADYLFIESTYGDRNHKNEEATFDELAEAIAYSYNNHDKVIIPAFAVGRTQEILYCLYLLRQKGKLPDDMPIFVDSPLAIRATEVFKEFKDYLDTPEIDLSGNMSALLPNLKFTLSALESQALNVMKGPAIIISASGMCNAGRIQHHLRHNAWRPTASIVFVGYQGVGTPGRKIVDGASSIRLFNEDVAIRPKFLRLAGFPRTPGRARFWIGSGKWRIPVCRSCWCMAKRKHSRSFPALSKTSSIFQCMLPAIWKKWLLRRELLPKWSLPPNRRVMRMWTGNCCLKKRKASFPSSVRALKRLGNGLGMNRLISGIVSLSSTRNCCPS